MFRIILFQILSTQKSKNNLDGTNENLFRRQENFRFSEMFVNEFYCAGRKNHCIIFNFQPVWDCSCQRNTVSHNPQLPL